MEIFSLTIMNFNASRTSNLNKRFTTMDVAAVNKVVVLEAEVVEVVLKMPTAGNAILLCESTLFVFVV